jgi:D-alanyl-D-alanine endopeptidase (penicillin-binding protein 7)
LPFLKYLIALLAAVFALNGSVLGAAEGKPRNAKPSSKAANGKMPQAARRKASKVASRKAAKQMAWELDDRVGESLVLRSASALVIDQRNGQVLFEKNAQQVSPIASITKLMTAMVVLDAALDLQETIEITKEDIDRFKGSHSRLPVRAKLTREHAMLLALMSSENRAAHALGRTYPGGLDAFVDAMNKKAQSLGMANSRFVDPTGLSSSNVSTARDLSTMVTAAHGYPLIRELSTTPQAYVDIGWRRPVGYSNTNALVKNSGWDIGLSKTGYISEAGKCLVMQSWVAGRPTVMVLLDSQGRLTRIGDANRVKRWLESSGTLASAAEARAS